MATWAGTKRHGAFKMPRARRAFLPRREPDPAVGFTRTGGDVRRVHGHRGAARAHGRADVRGRERGRVVDAVADEEHDAPRALRVSHVVELVRRLARRADVDRRDVARAAPLQILQHAVDDLRAVAREDREAQA